MPPEMPSKKFRKNLPKMLSMRKRIERWGRRRRNHLRMRIFQINPIYLGKPSASRDEILPQEFHHQVDGAYGIPHANIAAAAVLGLVEREAGVVVVMEGAERLMVLHLHPHLFRNLLYRKFAQFLNLIFLHHICFPFFFLAGIPVRYSAVLV